MISMLRALMKKKLNNMQKQTDNVRREMELLRMNKNKSTFKYFLVKLQKLKNPEKILKVNREKRYFNSMGRQSDSGLNPHRMPEYRGN